jgi:hypothetical protein
MIRFPCAYCGKVLHGHAEPDNSGGMRWAILSIALAVVVLHTGCSKTSHESQAATGELIQTDTMKILNAYMDNAASADASFNNKPVQFTLLVLGVDKDKQAEYYAWDNAFGQLEYRHFKCYFTRAQQGALASLKARDRVTLQGVCVGKTGTIPTMVAGVVRPYPEITIRNCELIGPAK